MSYSINRTPKPNIIRQPVDTPSLLDRYDDSAVSRQRLLNHQKVKIPPNELILAKLQKKKRKLKKTKNLRGELAQIKREQRRFEKGEKRDRPEDEPRIVGDPITTPSGVSFDPEIEKEKIRSQERIANQENNLELAKLNLQAQQLDLNRNIQQHKEHIQGHQLQIEDAKTQRELDQEDERIRNQFERLDEERRQFDELQSDRENIREQEVMERRIAQAENRADRERELERQERLRADDRIFESDLLDRRIGEDIKRFERERELELEKLARQTDVDFQRQKLQTEERQTERQDFLRVIETARESERETLTRQAAENRDAIFSRLSELDREREQREQQRQADFLRRGLGDVDELIQRRLREARQELQANFPRGEREQPVIHIHNPAQEPREPANITIQAPEQPQGTPQQQPTLSPRDRRDLAREISAEVRTILDPVEEPESPALQLPPREETERVGTIPQQRVQSRRTRSPSPELPPRPARELPPRGPPKKSIETQTEEVGFTRVVGPPKGPPKKTTETQTEEQGFLQTGFQALQDAGAYAYNRGQQVVDDYSRPAIGEQTGGVLRTGTGEVIFGLGQDIEPGRQQPEPERLLTEEELREAQDAFRRKYRPDSPTLRGRRPISPTQQALFDDVLGNREGRPRPSVRLESRDTPLQRAIQKRDRAASKYRDHERLKSKPQQFSRGGGERALTRLKQEFEDAEKQLTGLRTSIEIGAVDSQGRTGGTPLRPKKTIRVRVEDLEEEFRPAGGTLSPTEGLLEQAPRRGNLGPADIRRNFSNYQSSRTELDAYLARGQPRGKKLTIPFRLVNTSGGGVKKIDSGQSAQIVGVLGDGSIDFLPAGRTRSSRITRAELEKQIKAGNLRMDRR